MSLLPYKAPDRAGLRRFGVSIGLVFILIDLGGLGYALMAHRPVPAWPRWPSYPGVVLLAMGVAVPRALAGIHRVWMGAGHVLGWINLRVILSVVFVVLVTPLGLLSRLLGKDALGRKLQRSAPSYRVESQALARERMKEPF